MAKRNKSIDMPGALAWKGQGLAILDYYKGDKTASFVTHCSDGDIDTVQAENFFREYDEFPLIEQLAINHCGGNVLDIGAGAGCHALELQQRGLDVVALDISPETIYVMQQRGVEDCRLLDYKDIDKEQFDTILMMMNGIGVVGDFDGLVQFLNDVKRLLKKNGRIIFDSVNLGDEPPEVDLDRFKKWLKHGGEQPEYFGKQEFHIEYKNIVYPPFPWLFLDPILMAFFAEQFGWYSEVLVYQEDGRYLIRLSRATF